MPDPFCDTCRKPAVFSELVGWRHSTTEHKFGVPTHLDTSGHEVTAKDWWADKPQYLTAEQVVGITRHYGIPVYWAGEGGDVVAIGSDWRHDPTISDRLGITTDHVRRLRKEFDIPAGERRWLPVPAGQEGGA